MDWNRSVERFNELCTQNCVDQVTKLPDLSTLTAIALDKQYTTIAAAVFQSVFLEVEARWILGNYPKADVLAALALLLPLFPASGALVEHFLAQHGQNIFERDSYPVAESVLFAFYRILKEDRSRFKKYLPAEIGFEYLAMDNLTIRGLAILCLSIVTEASEELTLTWEKDFTGESTGSSEATVIPFKEAQRISIARRLLKETVSSSAHFGEDVSSTQVGALSSLVANVGGRLVLKAPNAGIGAASAHAEFIETPNSRKNLQNLSAALSTGRPVLLRGCRGCGKTFSVEYLHRKLCDPKKDMIRIHLGDQTDVKALIGTYTTGEKPGTFEWRPGMLTVAIMHGHWVLIEDLDKAPTDILSILLPLLEKRQLVIPSRNQVIPAHPDFYLFSTVTVAEGPKTLHDVDIIGKRAWQIVDLELPTDHDLQTIIEFKYPVVLHLKLAPVFVQIYNAVRFGDNKELSSRSREVTTRDLFKLCERVNSNLKHLNQQDTVPNDMYDDIYREAVSCFAGSNESESSIFSVAQIIGECLEIGSSKIIPLLSKHRPAIHLLPDRVKVGRGEITVLPVSAMTRKSIEAQLQSFALTTHSLRLLEEITVATAASEPLLLVGETGTGKTTTVQYLAHLAHRKLIVINISQQMETGDLLGGFKPVDARHIAMSLLEEFNELFDASFSRAKNQQFCDVLDRAIKRGQWNNVVKLWREAHRMAEKLHKAPAQETKRRKTTAEDHSQLESNHIAATSWNSFLIKVEAFDKKHQEIKKALVFQFIEGLLVKALRHGYWVLLDELNLAPADTLEGIADLLVSPPSITLTEKGGDSDAFVVAHPDFRLFACMNPATDVGKRDLPVAVRSRFTELYVSSPDSDIDDLRFIVEKYLSRLRLADQQVVNDVALLYLSAKELAATNKLIDGAGQKPHFSIRTLSRTLVYSCSIAGTYGLRRALYEGFSMSFLTLLDQGSASILHSEIVKHILGGLKNVKSVLSQVPASPGDEYIQFRHYWLKKGELEPAADDSYIMTPSVERNLLNLVRAAASKKFPVLIQGPTSSGKTSMIRYLAKRTGHEFVRINNHEHTDLQEYLGTYMSDSNGALVFKEGVLVDALRKGHWLVLDELNLAPTDVLEALNRLLDDNRELLIPETQEVVKPHPDFMLFATQNPPGIYAGRKMLSRAFRNRFLELHFDDIPENELELILKERCRIAPSHASKIVQTYKSLSQRRQSARVFEQKNSFATLRDLFRWAQRPAIGYEELARNGYFLLGERVRSAAERQIVKDVIEKVMRVTIIADYSDLADLSVIANSESEVVWTHSMKRVLVLVMEALKQNEPVLLVGETGSGKTTICQVLSHIWKRRLYIVNAHQNTETSDLLGAQRPLRATSHHESSQKLEELLRKKLTLKDEEPPVSLDELKKVYRAQTESHDEELDSLIRASDALFEWHDGPLVTAMKEGSLFLLDEISLADDSVLERLNSVLEPERSLLLPEKGSEDIAVTADPNFEFFATMNPGGDYGKKELSPALRNRFTEIWVPSMDNMNDVELIVETRLTAGTRQEASKITSFAEWFGKEYGNGDVSSGVISLRDVLYWVQFVNYCVVKGDMPLKLALFHGACMVFVDSLGTNALSHLSQSPELLEDHRTACRMRLADLFGLQYDLVSSDNCKVDVSDDYVKVGLFGLPRLPSTEHPVPFSLQAPTSALNAMRVIRAMTVPKPVLLEGSPGVGKTSLISALASICGRKLTRINLSDQTDLIDLFGSDVPAEGKSAGQFVWRDAPFLRAMKSGEWVLLDEMNLASQSVLEGLNACLDHRGSAYIPELDKTFVKHSEFMVFAAQNPQSQGGGRKGLPKSFVNRFSVVYMDSLSLVDLTTIATHLFPEIPEGELKALAGFIEELSATLGDALGGPFEFNLRDILRWLQLVHESRGEASISAYFDLVVGQRFRNEKDKQVAIMLFERHLGGSLLANRRVEFVASSSEVKVGFSSCKRNPNMMPRFESLPLHCNLHFLETALSCVQHSWPLLLVGQSGSGKTALLRYLAVICGAQLQEFAMSADVDSTDLLGEFDQVEKSQQLARLWGAIDEYKSTKLDLPARSLLMLWSAAEKRDLRKVHDLLETSTDLIAQDIAKAIDVYNSTDFSRPAFKWFDGLLVHAVERGHWLVLDNANLCNPSVLDRLNSLLEPNGVLYINECAEANGEPRKIVPHPNFRLFMTVDPKYGELSRAMRNRSVEVFMPILELRASKEDVKVLDCDETVSSLESGYLELLPSARYADAIRDLNSFHWLLPTYCRPGDTRVLNASAYLEGAPIVTQLASFMKFCDGKLGSPFALWVSWWLSDTLDSLRRDCNKSAHGSELGLLQLSLLKRYKPSVECADAFTFLERCWAVLNESDAFAAVAADFARYSLVPNFDASRIPVYRELFEKASESLSDPSAKLLKGSLQLLGRDYDFTNGGRGMERLWSAFALGGFSSKSSADFYLVLREKARAFDEVCASVSIENIDLIVDIRSALGIALIQAHSKPAPEILDTLSEGISQVEVAVSSTTKCSPPQFKDAFKSLSEILTSSYFSKRDTETLRPVILTASHLAGCSTESSAELYWPNGARKLYLPQAISLEDVVKVLLNVISQAKNVPVEHYEMSQLELQKLLTIVLEVPGVFIDGPESGMAELLHQFVDAVVSAVPESSKALTSLTDGTSSQSLPQKWIELSHTILELYICPSVYDPAIRQHTLYDINRRRRGDLESDLLYWQILRSVFVGDEPTTQDDELRLRLEALASESAPTTYRPAQSQSSDIYADIMKWRGLLSRERTLSLAGESMDLWISNLEMFLSRLWAYESYRDLTSIIITACQGLRYGVQRRQQATGRGDLSWMINVVELCSPSRVSACVNELKIDSDTAVRLQALKSCALDPMANIEPAKTLLHQFYDSWKLQCQKDDYAAEKAAATFRSADAESEEAEFLRAFPDFYGETSPSRTNQDADMAEKVNLELVNIFFALTDSSPRLDTCRTLIDACTVLSPYSNILKESRRGETLPSVFMAIEQDTMGEEPELFNFYHESIQKEVRHALNIASSTMAKIERYLDRWPEHETLLRLRSECEEILSLPVASPLALFLAKIEKLHQSLDEWQRYATKEVTVLDDIARVSDLIIRWRRLELATWPKLFLWERRVVESEGAVFWYSLYETLIVAPGDLTEIARILILFISEATFGQYVQRMNLINAFVDFVDRSDLRGAISNVLSYFGQYTAHIIEQSEEKEAMLRKEVEEVILLASWKDVNIHALKQSAQRSHRALYKIVRKYRDFLNSKVTPLVQGFSKGNTDVVKKLTAPTQMTIMNTEGAISLFESIGQWSSRPSRLRNLTQTQSNMVGVIENIAKSGSTVVNLGQFASDITSEASRLRDETPKTLTEANAKAVGYLKTEKARLFASSLKTLRAAGLRGNVRKDMMHDQSVVSSVLANTPTLSDTPFENANPPFYALVELMPRLRAAVSESQSDCPAADLRRGLLYAENIFARVIKSRRIAAMMSSDGEFSTLKKLEKDLTYIANGRMKNPIARSEYPEAVKLIQISSSMSSLLQKVAPSVALPKPVLPEVDDLWWQTQEAHSWTEAEVAKVRDVENALTAANKGVKALVSPLVQSWSALLSGIFDVKKSKLEPVNEDLMNVVSVVSDKVLVAFQSVLAVCASVPSSEDDDETHQWFVDDHLRLDKMLISLRLPSLVGPFQTILELCIQHSVAQPDLSAAFATILLPFAHGYRILCSTVAALYSSYQTDTCYGALKLATLLHSLATDGFCSPSEMDDEPADGQQQSGTGLGDGEGAQGTSNEVDEEDDDVAEAAQTSNSEQRERDETEEDHAKEIEGDMAGEIEDAPGDESEKEEDDAEDEMDEGVGEIGDLDPNAIDEKMWDDNKDDNATNEKDTDREVQGDQDDSAEAQENNDNMAKEESKPQDEEPGSGDDQEDAESDGDADSDMDAEDGLAQNEKLEESVEEKQALDLPDEIDVDGPEGSSDEEDLQDDDEMDTDGREGPIDPLDQPTDEVERDEDGEVDAMSENEQALDEIEEDADVNPADQPDADDENMEVDNAGSPEDDSADKDDNMDVEDGADDAAQSDEKGTDAQNAEEAALHGQHEELTAEADAQQSLATDQESGAAKDGADREVNEQQEAAAGAGGGADASTTNEPDADAEVPEMDSESSESRKQTRESLKQLGDAMKEFYKRPREIQDRKDNAPETEDAPVEENVNREPEDFAHIGEEDAWDTQALGKSSERQDIDHNMAIDESDRSEDEDSGPENHIPQDAGANADADGDMRSAEQREELESDQFVDVQSSVVAEPLPPMPQVEMEDDSLERNPPDHLPSRSNNKSDSQARELWRKYDAKTHDLTLILCEQLRLILEPTVATKLKGDYKTGKRLNMKRIVPYVASDFKKDKIWLRRTKPAKRQYQVMLALDDSKSMSEPRVTDLAYQAIALVAKSLSQVESGQLAVALFGEDTRVVHPFERPFTAEAGAQILREFAFDQERTNMHELVKRSLSLFAEGRVSGPTEKWQLEIIVSDGVCEDHDNLRALVRRARDQHVMLVFVVLDALNKDTSILEMNQVTYTNDSSGNPSLQVERYMDKFPFEYYVIVRNINDLPGILASVLRQYFQAVDC